MYNAMQVELTIGMWSGEAVDNRISREAERTEAAAFGTMRVVKELAPKALIHPIKSAAALGREAHYKMTLPGLTRGVGLLATSIYQEYFDKQREAYEKFEQASMDFIRAFPSILERAKARLGNAFDEGDYPTPAALKRKFRYAVRVFPVPQGKDWRLEGVIEADKGAMREQVEESVKGMYRDATAELYERFRGAIQRLADQMAGEETRIRAATLENLKDMVSIVPKMNITGDPVLHAVAKDMEAIIANVTPETIKGSAQAQDRIKAMLEKAKANLA